MRGPGIVLDALSNSLESDLLTRGSFLSFRSTLCPWPSLLDLDRGSDLDVSAVAVVADRLTKLFFSRPLSEPLPSPLRSKEQEAGGFFICHV